MLQWLQQHGVDVLTRAASETAASHGKLDALRWMLEEGLELRTNGRLCEKAAGGGRLQVLQWLHSIGCPLDVTVCTAKQSDRAHDSNVGEIQG